MRIKCIFYIDSNKKDSSHLCRTVHYFFRLRIKVIKISLSFSSKPSQISSISFCSFVRSNLFSSSEKNCAIVISKASHIFSRLAIVGILFWFSIFPRAVCVIPVSWANLYFVYPRFRHSSAIINRIYSSTHKYINLSSMIPILYLLTRRFIRHLFIDYLLLCTRLFM